MAATGAEPRGLDPLTLLRSGGEMKAGMGALDTKLTAPNAQDAIKLAENLRKVAKANSREAIENIAALKDGESKFELRNTKAFLERFGSGKKAVLNMTAEEKASFNTAEQLLRENATIALYLDLRSKTTSERKVLLADGQIKDAIGPGVNDYNQVRSKALLTIIHNATFINAFPEINLSGMSDGEKMQYIEATLLPAEDNRFAARLGTLTQEAYRKAVDFTTVAGDDKKTGMEQQEKLEKARVDQKVNGLKALLDGKGIVKLLGGGGSYTTADIKALISGSLTPEVAADSVAQDILNAGHTTFIDLKQYRIELPKEKVEIQRRIEGKRGATTFADYLIAYPADLDVVAHNTNEAELLRLSLAYPVGQANLVSFDTKILPLYLNPAFSNLALEAKQAELKASDLALQISVLPPGDPAEVAKSRDKRLLEEQDLIGQLDRVLGNSLRDVLLERYDIMEERQDRLMEKNAKDAEKDVAKLVLELKKKMNKNWISWDNSTTPQRKVDKKQIRADVTHLTFSADKDVALKQLIARDIFHGAAGATISSANFDKLNVVDGTDGAGTVLITEDQLKQLEKVFESSGQAYKDKLWADMFMGRGSLDKTANLGFGIELGGEQNDSLAFRKAVREEMMRKYEPEITKALEGNREASQAMKNLEAQGVKFDFNLKWIWYLLTIVLGLGAGAVAMPTGIAMGSSALSSIAAGTFSPIPVEVLAGAAVGATAGGLGGAAVVNKFSEN